MIYKSLDTANSFFSKFQEKINKDKNLGHHIYKK